MILSNLPFSPTAPGKIQLHNPLQCRDRYKLLIYSSLWWIFFQEDCRLLFFSAADGYAILNDTNSNDLCFGMKGFEQGAEDEQKNHIHYL